MTHIIDVNVGYFNMTVRWKNLILAIMTVLYLHQMSTSARNIFKLGRRTYYFQDKGFALQILSLEVSAYEFFAP